MADTNNGMFDSFLDWLLGLKDEREQLPSALKKYITKLKNSTSADKVSQDEKKNLQTLIDTDPQTRDMMSEYMKEFGIDGNKIKETEQLSKEFGKRFLTGWRGANAFGRVDKDIAALRDAVSKYEVKQKKLKAKGNASMEKIVKIEEALYKADKLKEEINKITGKDEKSKATKKELEKIRDGVIREASKLRAMHRPGSLVSSIEIGLRNTLSREKRAYRALTGQEIEIYTDGDGKPVARSVNVVEKLGSVIEKVDAIDIVLKNPIDADKYNNLSNEQKESLKGHLRDSSDPSAGLKEGSEENLKQQKSDLIKGVKHMRSLDHRGFLHENGILQELRWTHNRNQKKLSVESQELAAVKKEVDRYNQRITKAANTLEQRKQGKQAAKNILEGLGGIDTGNLKPTVSLPMKKQQTQQQQPPQ